ncbi:PD-(D/E)XK nuclease family protein [Paenibacillus sp. LHD-117]|uniref:PD-(D/E)XK nuclease family protein n=1 Tax=Paenibacillus sp. LHD-117 TaxID=3071412 RepID=UPI0027E0E9F8|nr:PD-(D/E)XK nuclease family protein [Paenibacillus sp. LHD-117]MDQ6422873.1 PD-(D/E)XK nuclease family protein [Paenibacillus sp. LHD-117]
MPMDLIDRLYEKLSEDPLKPKVLLTGTYAQGQQLLEQLCARKGAVAYAGVATVRGIAAERSKLELFVKGIALLDEGQTFWIVKMLMEELAAEYPEGYVRADDLKPGIVDGVHRAVVELRLAGLTAAELLTDAFTNPGKAEYVKQLLSRYETYLSDKDMTDVAGLLPYVAADSGETIYLAMEPTGWTRAERQMIEKIAGGRLFRLEAETPFAVNAAFAANSFGMFGASGSIAEVREGLRRLLAEPDARFDRAELLLSDYETYAAIVYAQAEAMGLPATLSGGLPLVYCPAGQAAVGLLDWIEEGYPVSKLAELLRHGHLRIEDERYTQSSWIRLLERSGVGWGKERYLALLEPNRLPEEKQEQGEALYGHAKSWLVPLPDGGDDWHPIRLLEWLAGVEDRYAARRSPEDQAVHSSLQELAARYARSPAGLMSKELAIRYVRGMLDDIRIRVAPTPKPGAVHVSSLADGGWSGRALTWIVGMDERSWSVSTRQDPVLLDEERLRLSPFLEARSKRASSQRLERESRIGLIRGEVWLSCSSYDSGEQKSRSAAFEMLQMYRLQSSDETKDFGALARALGEPYGVMDVRQGADMESRREPLDAVDAWAKLLANGAGERLDGREAIRRSYPALAEGYRAGLLRQADELSAYDGWLELDLASAEGASGMTEAQAGTEGSEGSGSLRSGRAHGGQEMTSKHDYISVSQLEQYASCGLRYYFGYVLKLRPKESAEFDRSRWLQANERGSLLHETYRRYMVEATGNGSKPAAHDRDRLGRLLGAVLSEFAAAIPAPSPHVFAKEAEEIRRDAEIFYQTEAASPDHPLFFELELQAENGEPMEVVLADGLRLRLKGFIDRIDRIGPHRYRIIDYKTGSPSKYKPNDYFSGGTQLQHAIYAVAAEQWLRESGYDALAEVAEADYSFPTVRGRGEFVRREQNRRDELAAVVNGLLDSRASGVYIPTSDPQQCRWCDYQSVCGAHAERMAEKRQLPDNAELLRTLLEVEELG